MSGVGVRSFRVRLRRGTALSAEGPRPSGVALDAAEASLLTFLGLEPLEDAVYRLLVDRPDSEPAALVGESTGCVEEVAPALDALVERGLASVRPIADADAVRYRASSPVLALGPLLESRRAALHRVESLVTNLAERHRSAQAHASGAPIEVLSGAAAIRRRLLLMQDQRVALLPLAPERDDVDPVALAVHGTGLLTALSSLFEGHFERGWRLLPSGADPGAGHTGGAGLDAVDRQIVSLLYVGLTDAAIARQLGMGHRTVQRRLQSLMAEVGAATRFQLGWHAACSGWLDETDTQSTPNRRENSAV
ncbi:hypothetical protein [Streptomyces sp. Ncost-T10-10d]|uniref:hypothetical protein n=1 Tax=Streptomyces sp. Ncost-T10-10d TaxID=1839774 RepID=UPI00114CAC39|nr:hypothetical protein [Streptomyces sp. Ncost-T10-10d]